MSALGHLWRHHRVALVAFVLAALVTLFFAVRMLVFTLYWADPVHHHQPLAGWMTPHYIARSWHVPPEVVIGALGTDPQRGKPRSLAEIARERGLPLSDLTAAVQTAIDAARAAPKP